MTTSHESRGIQHNRPLAIGHSRVWQGLAALPAGARGVVAQRLGAADRRFWAHRAGAGAVFSDSPVAIEAQLSAHGVTVKAGALTWSLGLQAVGRGGRFKPAGALSATVHFNQVTLRHAGAIEERYDYGPLGLEQGFTLGKRPPGAAGAAVLALGDVPRGVNPELARDERTMSLERGGQIVLRYWGLFARDALGRPLPARIALNRRALSLRIDDRGAMYPVQVDPFVQAAKLTASGGADGDGLGSAAAVSGDTIAVGAPNLGSGRGAVYVFVKPAGGWADATQTAKLTASDGAGNNLLGSSVAISGDTIVAGAPRATVSGHQAQGAAYVFTKPAGGWTDGTETSKLVAADGATSDQFGSSVAIDGSTIVVGAQWASPNAFFGAGAAYVFVNGVQAAKLLATNGQPEDNFGSSVGVSGDTVAVGAGSAQNLQGAVYVFVKPAGGWANATQTAKLLASDGGQADHLGTSVGVSGDTIAAGAISATVAGQRPGAVYVFVRPAGGWTDGTQSAKLSASDGVGGDHLGWSLGIAADTVVAGAPGAGGNSQGALYVFSKPAAGWANGNESAKLTASDVAGGDGFGESAAIASDAATVAGGSPAKTGGGAAYVFTPSGGGGSRATSASLLCFPATVFVGNSAGCRASVTDTGSGPVVTPTGTVSFSSDSHGTFAGPSCTLTQVSAGSAGCLVGYTPSAIDSGTHMITAAYPGDAAHSPSNGRASITVNPRPPVVIPPLVNAAPPVNTALPSISPARSCVVFLSGRLSCQPIPYTYSCNPGQWAGTDPAAPYSFEWQQSYLQTGSGGLQFIDWRTEATGQTFQYGPLFAGGSGVWRCAVTATGPGGSTVAYSPRQPLQGYLVVSRGRHLRLFQAPVDIRVTGIEVTQGTQEAPCAGCVFADPNHTICATCAAGTLPSRDQVDPSQPGLARYSGVTMAAGKDTVVRVFANFTDPDASRALSTLAGATAQLEVYDSAGNRILPPPVGPGSQVPFTPVFAPATLQLPSAACPLCVDLATRANPGSSFYFRIPGQYTYHRSLSFKVTVSPQSGLNQAGQCGGCDGNKFTLDNVPFKQPATVTIWPIPLTIGGVPVPPDRQQWLQQTFGDARTVMPNPLQILPWDGTLAVDGLAKSDAVEEVDDRAEDNNLPSSIMPIGVYVAGAYPGLSINTSLESGTLFNDGSPPRAIVRYCTAIAPAPVFGAAPTCRPLTSVAHEITHALAIGHADVPTRAPGDNTPDCGGDSGGSGNAHFGEAWPPDYEGRIQGVGLDRRYWNPLTAGSLPGMFVDGYDYKGNSAMGAQYYDYMSYCGTIVNPGSNPPEPNDWISPHNWQRLVDFSPPPQNLPATADRRARVAGGTPLRVIAAVDSNGRASIFDVTPGRRSTHLPTPGSPYRIELRDAAGTLLASAVPSTTSIHADGEPPGVLLSATLPMAASAASVAITVGGQVLASRVRSAHAPTARFLSPRPGSRLGRTRTTVVRFSARDADGDRLTSKIFYSPDGGRTWNVVAGPLTGTVARIPSRLLAGSTDGRLQVRVSDGFDLTTVTSGRLRVAGAPPLVQIIGSPARARVPETAMLPLQGWAFDDRGRPLTGRHLKWYLGKRLIGSGARVIAQGLRPGNTVLRLVATDSHGRRAQAILRLRVRAVAARYLLFYAPLLVSPQARSVRITAASTLPATFTIAGKHYALGPRERTIIVPIRPGRTLLLLRCSLRSPGGVIRGTYVAVRGGR